MSREFQHNPQNQPETIIQPALEIGKEDDEHEKEANAVADKVMRMSDGTKEEEEKGKLRDSGPKMQKMVQPKEDEERKKMVQPKEDEEKKKMVDTPSMIQKMVDSPGLMPKMVDLPKISKKTTGANDGMTASKNVEQGINSSKGSGQSLSPETQQEMGSKMGADFSGVKVHTDESAVQMNREVGAKAFTHGNDIYFNQGQYNPETSQGKHLLAHELTHTVQQGGGIQRQPAPKTYKVKTGDTLYSIAKQYNTTVEKIKELNNIPDDSTTIQIGQVLKIPDASKTTDTITPSQKKSTDNPNELKLVLGDKISHVQVYEGPKLVQDIRPQGALQDNYTVYASGGNITRVVVTSLSGQKETRILDPFSLDGPSYTSLHIIANPSADTLMKRKSPYPPGDYSADKKKAHDFMMQVKLFNTQLNAAYQGRLNYVQTTMNFKDSDLGKMIFNKIIELTLGAADKLGEEAAVVGEIISAAWETYKEYNEAVESNEQTHTFASLQNKRNDAFEKSVVYLQGMDDAIDTNFELMKKLSKQVWTVKNTAQITPLSDTYETSVWKEVLKLKFTHYEVENETFYKDVKWIPAKEKTNITYWYTYKPGEVYHFFSANEKGYYVREHNISGGDTETDTQVADRIFNKLKVPKATVFQDWGLPRKLIVIPDYSTYGQQ